MEVGFRVNMGSPAMTALCRLKSIASQSLYKDIAVDVDAHTKQQWKDAWRGESIAQDVYTVVKRVLLGHTTRGLLTGSTAESIQTQVIANGVESGPIGSWPSTSGSASAPFDVVSKGLERFLGFSLDNFSFAGDVTMTWGPSGLRITWPWKAARALGFQDLTLDPEPYEGKLYGKSGRALSDMFFITPELTNDIFAILDSRVDAVWSGGAMARDFYETGAPIDADVAEIMAEEINRGGGSRAESVIPGEPLGEQSTSSLIPGEAAYMTPGRVKDVVESAKEELTRLMVRQALEAGGSMAQYGFESFVSPWPRGR